MTPLNQIASCCIEPGPARPTTGHGLQAWGVSSVLHVALAVLGVAVGVSESAILPMQSGHSAAPQTLTLQAAFSPPTAPLTVLQPRGMETADVRQPETPEAVEPIEWPRLTDIESPAPPPPATAGQPDGVPQTPLPLTPPEESPAEETPTTPSPAAEATATASDDTPGAQIDQTARPLPTNHPPAYPPQATAENREGRAVLRVVVDRQGVAREVTLLKSSGHEDLDAAAIAAVARWRFAPALQNKTPVEQTIAVPIRFVNRR